MTFRLAVVCGCIGISFYLGYHLGLSEIMTSSPALHDDFLVKEGDKTTDSYQKQLAILHKNDLSMAVLPKGATQQLEGDKPLSDKDTAGIQQTFDSQIIANDFEALFDSLSELRTNSDDYTLYAKKIDEVISLLTDSPAETALLAEYYESLPSDSDESYLIVSILQSLPENQGRQALTELAERTLNNASGQGTQQFLDLVGRTGIVNEQITEGLKQIALFSEQHNQGLDALDMLMPYQLSASENQQVLTRLEEMQASLENGKPDQYLFSQTIRFSSRQQRTVLAQQVLSDSNADIAKQAAILNYIEIGQIPSTPQAKELLFKLTQNETSKLRQRALTVLVSNFDISQEEYRTLTANTELQALSIR